MERPARPLLLALPVELAGDGQGVGIRLDDGVEPRPAVVDLVDALEVERDELLRGRFSRRHHLLKPGDRRLLEGKDGLGGFFAAPFSEGRSAEGPQADAQDQGQGGDDRRR